MSARGDLGWVRVFSKTPILRARAIAECCLRRRAALRKYAYVYVQQDADEMKDQDVAKAAALRNRAKAASARAVTA